MFIHATNITGVGATHVVTSFIDAATELEVLNDATIFLPADGPLSNYHPLRGRILRYKRKLANSYSRLFECFFAQFLFPQDEQFIVLGDIPLRGIKNQVVLVHQPNLIYPSVNKLSSKRLTYRIFRLLFKYNLKFAERIIVQTQVMADELRKSYPKLKNKTVVIPQPVPNWFKSFKIHENKQESDVVKLFYPAAGYPHKNHKLLIDIFNNKTIFKSKRVPFEIWLTLSDEEYLPYKDISFIKNFGRLKPTEVVEKYKSCDAVLFLSVMESYGLPLVEALTLNLPIICADLPYARWMCEEKGFYFQYDSALSFINSFIQLQEHLKNKKQIDYSAVLSKFPEDWKAVVAKFIE